MKPSIPIVQEVLTLKSKQYLSPHYIRAVLTGNVATFKGVTLGDNNKIFIPPPGTSKVHLKSFDSEKGEWVLPPEELRPIIRTYTTRALDLERGELTIDFVDHGPHGPASNWAIGAEPGSELGVAMKLNKKELFPMVDHYVLVGDATAIPVLGVILEGLPASAKGQCIIEVQDPEDRQDLRTPADIGFTWLYNPDPGRDSKLPEALKEVPLAGESRFAFVACEYGSVKEIRQYLRKERQWTSGELYAFSYWKKGVAEDKSAQDRREERQTE